MNADKRALFYALAAVLLWSTVATAFKITLTYLTPLQMVAAASTVSWVVLLIICLLQGKLSGLATTFLRQPLYYVALGLINPAVYYLVLFKAYDLLPASQAQPLNYTWAIALSFLAAIVLKQKIRKRDWLAALLGYLGVLVIATRGNLLELSFSSPLGVTLALLSTLLWAGYWILNTRHPGEPVVSLLLGFSVAVPVLLLVATWQHGWAGVPIRGWLAVSYVGLFEMGITFFLWLKAMREASNVALISNLIFISPFISLLLLALIIGEVIYPATVVGLLLIVLGLLIQRVVIASFLPVKRWRRSVNSKRS
ncbi:DMT family transporter [Aliidiomarina soli]|uniref:EamA family transporter n=1 Tax=Aliidiomarina soli TaxID=1928574 RepID=A0A432WFJ5_9GAMM|nr:DMT family transporter [Aliidiomarina soli]RUO32489.1 EamA family transporter [Aliidiomarina soli]